MTEKTWYDDPILPVVSEPPREKHMPSTAWQPGVSGNPAGRPPLGHALSDVLRKYLDVPRDELERLSRDKTLPAKDALCINQILASFEGRDAAQRAAYTFDRLEGRPKQAVDQTVRDERPIERVYTDVPRPRLVVTDDDAEDAG